jgi:hypothetical protein
MMVSNCFIFKVKKQQKYKCIFVSGKTNSYANYRFIMFSDIIFQTYTHIECFVNTYSYSEYLKKNYSKMSFLLLLKVKCRFLIKYFVKKHKRNV